MISAFRVDGFKCFESMRLDLARLTVLTGINGSGKSSFIQALLLAQLSTRDAREVSLNGRMGLQLGQALDVIRGQQIVLTTESSAGTATWTLVADADDALVLRIAGSGEAASTPHEFGSELVYLQAERLGPRNIQDMDVRVGQSLNVGVQGEFVAHVLALQERSRISDELCHPSEGDEPVPTSLGKQVELWMQELVPGIQIRPEVVSHLSVTAIRLKRSGQSTDWLRAQNTGFGVSYALPIVVAALVARPGSMMIIENPEAHLHPRGQSLLARFLARVATSGVQLLVETHSEHFVNGLRLAVVDEHHPLGPEDVKIAHFLPADGQPQVETIRITERGALSAAPTGFFDQSEQDLAAILQRRR